MSNQRTRPLAVLSSTPDDSHVWNLVGIDLELKERGFEVLNLGPVTPADLLAQTIRDMRPDLVVLSSINGHARHSIPQVLETLRQWQVLRAAPIVAGGLLSTDWADLDATRSELAQAGISGVFQGANAWQEFDAFLETTQIEYGAIFHQTLQHDRHLDDGS